MAVATTQLFPRQAALLASRVPRSIDSVAVGAALTATYTVPAATGIIVLSTDEKCAFRDSIGGTVAATLPAAGAVDGEESTWLHPTQDRAFRVEVGQVISFHGDGTNDATVTIERYTGTNATLPPD